MIINKFEKQYRFLSNFYKSKFILDGAKWNTVEHYYQAHKACNMKDLIDIQNTSTAGMAKKLGQSITLRSDWNEIRDNVMMKGLVYKFNFNPDLRDKLVETNEYDLVEGNTWCDNYFGNCTCDKCKDIEGLNKLGKMLMVVRDMHAPFMNI